MDIYLPLLDIFLISSFSYIDELNEAISLSNHKPSKCIIFQRKGIEIAELDPQRDMDWEEALKNVESAPCVSVEANEPLYILYTSGTTGKCGYIQLYPSDTECFKSLLQTTINTSL